MNKKLCFVAGILVLSVFLASAPAKESNVGSDVWLESRLYTTYTLNEHLNPFDLDVDVKNGVAHISGVVETDTHRDLAVEIARGFEGIDEVKSDIRVDEKGMMEKKANEFYRGVQDATVKASVRFNLFMNRNIEGDIDVSVEDNVATLSGYVNTDAQRELAVKIARNTEGVKKVDERLDVKKAGKSSGGEGLVEKTTGEITDAWITGRVKTALGLNKYVSAMDINVDTTDGVVMLDGVVFSERQKEIAMETARSIDSVKKVKSKLTVK